MAEIDFLNGSSDFYDYKNQRLTKLMTNELFESIRMARLNPASFRLIEHEYTLDMKSYVSSGLIVLNTEYFCLFFWAAENYRIRYCPHKIQRVHDTPFKPWPEIFDYFKDWLAYLKIELELPDLWAGLEKARPQEKLPELADAPESHYTYDQVEQLGVLLDKAKKEIIERFDLNKDQIEYLNKQVEYLVDQAKKQPIRDWRNILIGTLVTTAMNLAIPQDTLPIFWSIVRNALESIRHLIGI